MNKVIFSLFFIIFCTQVTSTTIEAELAKPDVRDYELNQRFEVLTLKNSDDWCYLYKGDRLCVSIQNQIRILNNTNFLINDTYKTNVKYNQLKKNKSCTQHRVQATGDYPFTLMRKFFCIEDNNIIAYMFKYYPDIKGVGLDAMYYATCSSRNFDDYKLPLVRKFNSFHQSQKPLISPSEVKIWSPISGEIFSASISILSKDSAINCPGNSSLGLLVELRKSRFDNFYNGWNMSGDLYTDTIQEMLKDSAKQNNPKF